MFLETKVELFLCARSTFTKRELDMEEQRVTEEREKHATKLDRLKHETEMR